MPGMYHGKGASAPQPFRLFAGRYCESGLSVFPCKGEDGKKPMVKWSKYQHQQPTEKELQYWAQRFSDANIAIVTGSLSNITVIDSDNPNLKPSQLFEQFGETPLIAQTPRGGYHLYYQHNGERNTPPISIPNVDCRGEGGYVIAPPSINPANHNFYNFVMGDLSEVAKLPCIRLSGASSPPAVEQGKVAIGGRNRAIFSHLIQQAGSCDTPEVLFEIASLHNQKNCLPPLEEKEVWEIVKSAWTYKEKGQLFLKGQQNIMLPIHKLHPIMFNHPRAFALYADLTACHKDYRKSFAISPQSYAKRSGWDAQSIRDSIKVLLWATLIKVVHKGGAYHGDATLYQFDK
jgi:hypothetical protein